MFIYRGHQNLNLTAIWQYDKCGTQGYTYDGVWLSIYGTCSTTQGLHSITLRIGIMSYMCLLLISLPMIVLRHTINNNSPRGLRLLFWIDGREQYLSWVVHQTIVRTFNRYLLLVQDNLHVSSDIDKL